MLPDPSIFHEDGRYNFDCNCGKPNRSRAAKVFDRDECKQRGTIESIFWGEESKRHQLDCGFVCWDNCCRFGRIRAIAWNIKVLNCLRYARMLGIGISSYDGMVCRYRNVCASV